MVEDLSVNRYQSKKKDMNLNGIFRTFQELKQKMTATFTTINDGLDGSICYLVDINVCTMETL
jgi:hypothetical protein